MYESRKPDRKKNVSTPLSAASTMKNHGPRSADQVAPEIASGLSYPLMPCSPQQTKLLGRPATAHRSLMVARCCVATGLYLPLFQAAASDRFRSGKWRREGCAK
jgi:hypothetical protein